MMRRAVPVTIVGALLAIAGAPHARAQGIDLSHGGPITVTARDGMDWLQNEQQVVARGDARAVRGTVTVTADTLIAHYRKKATAGAPPAATPAHPAKPLVPGSADDTGSSEIYRLDAIGHVHIFTPSDNAWGDKAVYDMDQAVLVLTGSDLRLTTPQDIITARDDMEYWSQKHMSVARGNAVVVTSDAKRVAADTLVSYSEPNAATGTPAAGAGPAGAGPAGAGPAGGGPAGGGQTGASAAKAGGGDDLAAGSHIKRVEAYGNVSIRTVTETVYGDRGVYLPDSGLARVVGHVRITRGENQVNGVAADVNLNTGVSTLLANENQRVQGLIMPNEASSAAGATPPARAAVRPPSANGPAK